MMNHTSNFSLSSAEILAWQQIENSKKIIITSHIHPDGDAVGSALALMRYCRDHGKSAEVIIDDDVPDIYGYLAGIDEIKRPYVGMEADLLIIVDTNTQRIGNVNGAKINNVLNIDHHSTNPGEGYSIIRSELSSACELLFQIFILIGYDIDAAIAESLYTGLITDTVFFKAPTVNSDTYRIAAELMDLGVDNAAIIPSLEKKEYSETKMIAKALSEIDSSRNGTVVGVVLDEAFDALVLTDAIIDSIRFIKGVEIAYLLKHEPNGGYRVRMRSQTYDISGFAGIQGGGGHSDAAGFTIREENAAAAKKIFLREIEKWLEQYTG